MQDLNKYKFEFDYILLSLILRKKETMQNYIIWLIFLFLNCLIFKLDLKKKLGLFK